MAIDIGLPRVDPRVVVLDAQSAEDPMDAGLASRMHPDRLGLQRKRPKPSHAEEQIRDVEARARATSAAPAPALPT